MNNIATINLSTESVIRHNKNNSKVDKRKFYALVEAIAKETGLNSCLVNEKVTPYQLARGYECFSIYGLFHLNFRMEDGSFRGFVGDVRPPMGLSREGFQGYSNRSADIIGVLENSKKLKEFRQAYDKFVRVMTNVLDIKWTKYERDHFNEINCIYDFYEFLEEEFGEIAISFASQQVYLNRYNKVVSLVKSKYKYEEEGVSHDLNNIRVVYVEEKFNQGTLDNIKMQIKDISNKIKNSSMELAYGANSLELLGLFNEIYSDYRFSDQKRKLKVIQYLEEAVPGNVVEVVMTSIPVNINIGDISDGLSLNLKYYKCDVGFYVIESEKKRVVFKETEKELKAYLLEQIAKQL